MALTWEKTYQFGTGGSPLAHVNHRVTGSVFLDIAREVWLWTKNALKAVALFPWSVRYSCNSVVAGTAGDGVDRWVTGTDLVWHTTGAHSWIVLKQSGIQSNFQALISLKSTSVTAYQYMTIAFSPNAGFTGGSTTVDPTATDQITILSAAAWFRSSTTVSDFLINVAISSDGQINRIAMANSGDMGMHLWFDRPKNPKAHWANPSYGLHARADAGSPGGTYSIVCDAAKAHGYINAGDAQFYLGTVGFGVNPMGQQIGGQDSQDLDWEDYPIWLCSVDSPRRGTKGQVFDAKFAVDNPAVVSGLTYPPGGPYTAMVMKDLILPWPNVAAVLS